MALTTAESLVSGPSSRQLGALHKTIKTNVLLTDFLQCGSVLSGVHTGNLKVLIKMVYIFCAVPTGNKMNNSHANDASAPADLLFQITK